MTELYGPEVEALSGEAPQQVVILLHGLGADGNDLIGLVPMMQNLLPYAHFIAPNAPFPCDMAPFGRQWFSLQDRSPEVVLAGVQEAAPILDAFIDEQIERFSLSADKIALLGFSQGTMMSLYVALRRKTSLAGVLGYSGAMVAPELLEQALQSKPPVCLVHGDADDVVPFDNMGIAQAALDAHGVFVQTHRRPGVSHSIDAIGLEVGVQFLQGVLN